MTQETAVKTDNQALKDALYKELELKLDLGIHGVNFNPEEIKAFSQGSSHSNPFGANTAYPTSFNFLDGKLSGAVAEGGLRLDTSSAYGLVVENNRPVIYKFGPKTEKIGEIVFRERRPHHPLLDKVTRDGVPFHSIASINEAGQVHVNYSQECVLKDKGEDCYFCNYSVRNATLKTPQQVGEVFSTLYQAGVGKHLNLTSGFMHERRELEYYLDVAEEIKQRTGLKDFRATAVVGAPLDLSVIEKYKEAGFFSIRMNIEIWDKHIWQAICPGKHKYCGGWENWVKALEHAVEVFGKGRVASNIVGGIEPKKSILEGAEYKISRGIVASASTWRPVAGSFLEGHRSPETSWHLDLQRKIAALYKKYGFTFADLHNVSPSAGLAVTVFQIEAEDFENGTLRPWRYPESAAVK
jgi:hypothetical protein